MDNAAMICCTTCGYAGTPEDFDQHPNGSGVWYPDCETFIWHNPQNNNQHLNLLLEQKALTKEGTKPIGQKLNKRLSPLRYPGGKSKLIDCLFANLQTSKCDTFVEVFAGGASFGLALLDAGIVKNLVLNDKDPYLINFWSQVINNPDGLIKRLSTISPARADYDQAKVFLSEQAPPGSRTPLGRTYCATGCPTPESRKLAARAARTAPQRPCSPVTTPKPSSSESLASLSCTDK